MTPRERLAAIEARAEAATDGPWTVYQTIHAEPMVILGSRGYPAGLIATPSNSPADYGLGNATFIAAARDDVPADAVLVLPAPTRT